MSEKKQKILIIDDSKEFLVLLSSLIKFHNIELDSESNPTKAADLIKEGENYSLIITDYMMPEMDGMELINSTINSNSYYENRFILLTAKSLEDEIVLELKKRKITYLTKPILPNELFKIILEHLKRLS